MNIVLHIGAPKTGSSALQKMLNENRSALLDFGYYYPAHDLDSNGISGGHSRFSSPIAEDDLEPARAWIESELNESARLGKDLLVSAESLYGFPGRVQLLNLDREADIRVIGYFRHPAESVISNYGQHVKRALLGDSLEVFCHRTLKGRPSPFYGGGAIDDWVKGFGADKVAIRPFDHDRFFNGSIEDDFLMWLGVPAAELNRFERAAGLINASYTPSALRLKTLLNPVLEADNVSDNALLDEVLQRFSDGSDECRGTAREYAGSELYLALSAHFARPIEHLKELYFGIDKRDYWRPDLVGEEAPTAPLQPGIAPELVLESTVCRSERLRRYVVRSLNGSEVVDENLATINALVGARLPESTPQLQRYLLSRSPELLSVRFARAGTLLSLGHLYEHVGYPDKALAFIDRASELAPLTRRLKLWRKRLLAAPKTADSS